MKPKFLDDLLNWWKRRKCEHFWRPALIGWYAKPHRYCEYCHKKEELSESEFYAQFGRMPRI